MSRMTLEEARNILEVGSYASASEVRTAYKRLALKYHPDKVDNSSESTKKFQGISAAYKRLTEDDDTDVDDEYVYDLFRRMFKSERQVTLVYTEKGVFILLGPRYESRRYSDDEEEDFDSSHYSFQKQQEGASNEPDDEEMIKRKKAEKNKQKRQRQKENKRQAKETLLKEREEIRLERHKMNMGSFTPHASTSQQSKGNDKEKPIEKEKKTVDKPRERVRKKERKQSQNRDEENKKEADNNEKYRKEKTSVDRKKQKNNGTNPAASLSNPTPQTKKMNESKKEMKMKQKQDESQRKGAGTPVSVSESPCASGAQTKVANTVEAAKPSKSTNIDINTNQKQNEQNNINMNNEQNTLPESSTNKDSPSNIAIQGSKKAAEGKFEEAIDLFTRAVQVDDANPRLYGNLSLCYERLGEYEKSLECANKATELAPHWSKGYFRKGKALSGLKKYKEAEESFVDVLKIDELCHDARLEIYNVRVMRLQEMGFTRQQSILAVHKYSSVDEAVEKMLAGALPDNSSEDVYYSDDDQEEEIMKENISSSTSQVSVEGNVAMSINHDEKTQLPSSLQHASPHTPSYPQHASPHTPSYLQHASSHTPSYLQHASPHTPSYLQHASPHTSDVHAAAPVGGEPVNLDIDDSEIKGKSTIWVGNLTSRIIEEHLYEHFKQYGSIKTVKINRYRKYANIVFTDEKSAAEAIKEKYLKLRGISLILDYPRKKFISDSIDAPSVKPKVKPSTTTNSVNHCPTQK